MGKLTTATVPESDYNAYSLLALPSWSITMQNMQETANDEQSKCFDKIAKIEKRINRITKQLLLMSLLLILLGIFFIAVEMNQFFNNNFGKTMIAQVTTNQTANAVDASEQQELFNLTTTSVSTTKIYSKPEYCLAEIANNRWNLERGVPDSTLFMSVDGLFALNLEGENPTNVRTREPFSMLDAVLTSIGQCNLIYYYFELLIQKNKNYILLGLTSPDVKIGVSEAYWLDKKAHTFGITTYNDGRYWQSGNVQEAYGSAFGQGDTMGCGLMLLVENRQLRRQLFFTKNGHIYGKPIWLPNEIDFNRLSPTVALAGKGTAVEANFGGNLRLKPFRYNLATHEIGQQKSTQG